MSDELGDPRATTLAWFLRNYMPAPPSPWDASFSSDFGSGGRPAAEFLAPMFTGAGGQGLIVEVAGFLPGLWVPRAPSSRSELASTREDYSALLLELLEALSADIRRLAARRVGRGHNASPEGLVETDGLPDEFLQITDLERETVLRATNDARLAVLSKNLSAIGTAWRAAAPILRKVADGISRQLALLAPCLRLGLAALAVVQIGTAFQIVTQAQAVEIAIAAMAAVGGRDLLKK